jgi:hypothetical protein
MSGHSLFDRKRLESDPLQTSTVCVPNGLSLAADRGHRSYGGKPASLSKRPSSIDFSGSR